MSSDAAVEFKASRSSAPHPVVGALGIAFFVWLLLFGDLADRDLIVLRPLQRLGDWWPLPLTIVAVLFCGLLVAAGAQARFAGPMVTFRGDSMEVLSDIPFRSWGRVRLHRRELRSVSLVGKPGRWRAIRIDTAGGAIRCGLSPEGTTREAVAKAIMSWKRPEST